MENANAKMGGKRANNKFDDWCAGGKMDKYFKITERGSNMTTEIRAGCTTFLTAAYIMAVNPNILSVTGLNFEGLVFATAMSSFIATLIMALWANLPFGLWPGMGMNAYFAYTIVGFKGTLNPAKKVMFCVFIEGIVFIVLSLLDVRRKVFRVFPPWLMKSSMAGIGLFLAHIGFQAGNGIDLIRAHPAILVDIVSFTGEHQARTFLGVFFFFVMATLVMLKVKGAVMIGILLSTFFCWILEASGTPQFKYQPVCCLGNMKYDSTVGWFPKTGSSYLGPELKSMMPKPTCDGPAGVFEVEGTSSNFYIEGAADGSTDGKYVSSWSGSSVTGGFFNWTVTAPDGTVNYVPGKALQFKSNGDGRNSLGFEGDCFDTCHGMFGGFGGVTPGVYGYGACFGSVLIDTGCWTSVSYKDVTATDNSIIKATSGVALSTTVLPYVNIDGFGEGCIGGAGRLPKTFAAPSAIFGAPKAALAKGIEPPFPGWFGCDANGANCWAGNVGGGTFWAFDFENLTVQNFFVPLLVLLYVDFIGTMAFLYAAADLSGMIDPAKPDDFPGCYAAFMADAIGTCVGGLLGTSSVTTYGESMAGVYEGGRTGMTALVISILNFLCIFLAPFISSVPTISTGPALIMVGVFMIEGVKDIDWSNYMQAIPSMICILLQPITYKIEVGVAAGFACWMFMMFFSLRFTLFIPGLWNALPECLKAFVARQDLQPSHQARLEALGYAAPAQKTESAAA